MNAMTATCRRCSSTVPHRQHLFPYRDGRTFAMRVTREQASVFMPDGTLLARTQPGAVAALKIAVRAYLAKVPA